MNDLRLIAAKIWSKYVTVDGCKVRQRLTWSEILESDEYRNKMSHTLKYGTIISKDYIDYICEVPQDVDDQINKLYELIKISQMAVYRFFSDKKRVDQEKQKIANLREQIVKLQTVKWKAHHYTIEGQLDRLQEEYEFKLKCNNINVFSKYLSSIPSMDEVRSLARSMWYQQFYENSQISDVDGPFTDIQSHLLSYVIQYKNVYELPEKPNPEIIDDDDAFDGWMLVQSKKQATTPKQSSIHQGKQHVFQFANNQEEAEQIYLSNDGQAGALQQARLKELREKGLIINR